MTSFRGQMKLSTHLQNYMFAFSLPQNEENLFKYPKITPNFPLSALSFKGRSWLAIIMNLNLAAKLMGWLVRVTVAKDIALGTWGGENKKFIAWEWQAEILVIMAIMARLVASAAGAVVGVACADTGSGWMTAICA
ncbi:hypothetical protein BDDG_04145 [Blastomyces dermatitidis ATCC 18188]|uniref:Uncharacterized protein n=1 Tax=Ajellomyces dermatitidis (strain ATCC 18188 / CBS 674.68) TaxID=653446 RepID=F2TD93_AJEDA|nr:hypothetical protein BDDG_04145 [Blastomyces dermatitidis ATCC 18188]